MKLPKAPGSAGVLPLRGIPLVPDILLKRSGRRRRRRIRRRRRRMFGARRLCGDEAKVSCAQRAADVHMKCAESTTSCPFVSSVLVKLPSGGEKRKSRKWAVVFSAYVNIFHSCLLEFSVYRLHLTKKTLLHSPLKQRHRCASHEHTTKENF